MSLSEIMFSALHPDNGAPLHDECVIAVPKKRSLHLEFNQGYVTDGMRSPWKLLVDVVSKSFLEVVKVVQKLENTVFASSPLFVCSQHSPCLVSLVLTCQRTRVGSSVGSKSFGSVLLHGVSSRRHRCLRDSGHRATYARRATAE